MDRGACQAIVHGVRKSDNLAQHRAGMNLDTGRNECSETVPGRPLKWILKTVEL